MKKYNVYAIGNALVDLEFEVGDSFLLSHKIAKGGMTLISEEQHLALLENLGSKALKQQSGGSAANSVIAISQMGGKCFYSCKVAADEMGQFYGKDLRDAGVQSNLDQSVFSDGKTGKCIVMITPDAERSMCTYLGISSSFSKHEIVEQELAHAEYLYIEGYLVASPTGFEAALYAKELAKKHGVKVALTLSDLSMVKFFKSQVMQLLEGKVDLLFCNDSEAKAICDTKDLIVARNWLKGVANRFVITQGENGAMIFDGDTFLDLESYPVKAIDSNGAGDMFAGSFLFGITHGHTYASSGKLASLAASKVVAQYGPRLKWHQTQEVLQSVFGKKEE